ncbi:MAG: M48 family metalloprotease [Undibacterium sp.]|nr:M48 family metalloprotease [Undibacterium sp.]
MTLPLSRSPELLRELAKPSPSYTRRAWLAMGALALFMTLYLLLATWFLFTAYRLSIGAGNSGSAVWGWGMALCAVLLAAFMLKGFFFVKRGVNDDSIEITPMQEPRLFQFLFELADLAGAPRPHRVFVSARVNAAVFYDLSIVNLFFPSKKNLEIGLGLVNVLNLGELRAVLAHEFGHFAQKAMAVGRWVYIAQQIAGNLVARRDSLDDFLNSWSRIDFRLAWMAWILSIIVWSIRSLVDTVFSVVVMIQRALSREMEMQADLVAVSLTGSDALIHALHHMQAADDAWNRAVNFAFEEKEKEKIAPDLFQLQSEILERMAILLGDENYKKLPPLPLINPEQHRVFKADFARPPQMWLTHPLNHEREENAKRRYIPADIDQASAWAIFESAPALREQVTLKFLQAEKSSPCEMAELLKSLDKQFQREHLHSRYRGVYYGRSPVRFARGASEMYLPKDEITLSDLDSLYPESISQDIEQLAQIEKELGQLRAVQNGVWQASGKTLHLRGRELKSKDIPKAITEIENELAILEDKLFAHDKRCRSVYMLAANQVGNGWPEYLFALLELIHYADHTIANIRDQQGLLSNTVSVVTATRKVSSAGVNDVISAAGHLYALLENVFKQSTELSLDHILRQRLEVASWQELLGEFKLSAPNQENISSWLDVIDSWVGQVVGACSALRLHALEQLLISEAVVARHAKEGKAIISAPTAPTVAKAYDTLIPGKERKRQTKLDWWARFQIADGVFATLARFGVASGIVVAVLGFGAFVGGVDVTVYNGLARTVRVNIAGKTLQLAPFASGDLTVDPTQLLRIETKTAEGVLIETFASNAEGAFSHFVYNVGAASPLIEWTHPYGNASPRPDRMLGAPRWISSNVDVFFADPPKSISSKTGGGTRDILTGFGNAPAGQQLAMLSDPKEKQQAIRLHARWDDTSVPETLSWLTVAQEDKDFSGLIQARLKEAPEDVVLRRTEQDMVGRDGRAALCEKSQERARQAANNPDLRYLALRCMDRNEARRTLFIQAQQQWPKHGWLAYAAGYAFAENMQWNEALTAFASARRSLPVMSGVIAEEQLRITRLVQKDTNASLQDLVQGDRNLELILAIEKEKILDTPELQAYQALYRGQLERAVSLVKQRPQSAARVLRLAAASVGASADLKAQALALDVEQGVDYKTVFSAMALALTAQKSIEPYFKVVHGMPSEVEQAFRQFVEHFMHKDFVRAEHDMLGMAPEYRAQAYSMAVVVLGKQAPVEWRDAAKHLLFVSERPYLG